MIELYKQTHSVMLIFYYWYWHCRRWERLQIKEGTQGRGKRARKDVFHNESMVLKSVQDSSDVSLHFKNSPSSIQQEWRHNVYFVDLS